MVIVFCCLVNWNAEEDSFFFETKWKKWNEKVSIQWNSIIHHADNKIWYYYFQEKLPKSQNFFLYFHWNIDNGSWNKKHQLGKIHWNITKCISKCIVGFRFTENTMKCTRWIQNIWTMKEESKAKYPIYLKVSVFADQRDHIAVAIYWTQFLLVKEWKWKIQWQYFSLLDTDLVTGVTTYFVKQPFTYSNQQ